LLSKNNICLGSRNIACGVNSLNFGKIAMDDEKRETDDIWTSLVVGLAAAWTTPEPVVEEPPDYGERLLAAARAVSRGRHS